MHQKAENSVASYSAFVKSGELTSEKYVWGSRYGCLIFYYFTQWFWLSYAAYQSSEKFRSRHFLSEVTARPGCTTEGAHASARAPRVTAKRVCTLQPFRKHVLSDVMLVFLLKCQMWGCIICPVRDSK